MAGSYISDETQLIEAKHDGWMSLTVDTATGTSSLEALCGPRADHATATWVAVPDGTITVDGKFTFYALVGETYRVKFAGTPTVWLAGHG